MSVSARNLSGKGVRIWYGSCIFLRQGNYTVMVAFRGVPKAGDLLDRIVLYLGANVDEVNSYWYSFYGTTPNVTQASGRTRFST